VLVTVAEGGDGAGPDADGGTELTILHGPHGEGAAEQAARSDHREGWEYFLARLGKLLASALEE
jgi:hypothetical protein